MPSDYEVQISDQALQDILEIYNNVFDFTGVYGADRLILEFRKKISRLRVFPQRGRLFNKERGLRVVKVKKYHIIFYVNQNSKTVTVVRFVSKWKDITRLIK